MIEESLLRMEHKLDVIISYLHGMTNVPPSALPRPVLGMGGLTDGKCPITGTAIRYAFDQTTGGVVRKDGLLDGISSALPVPEPPTWDTRSYADETATEVPND